MTLSEYKVTHFLNGASQVSYLVRYVDHQVLVALLGVALLKSSK